MADIFAYVRVSVFVSRLWETDVDVRVFFMYVCVHIYGLCVFIVQFDEKLGTGAYKSVWLAYDTDRGIEVAWNTVRNGCCSLGSRTCEFLSQC